MNLLLLLSAMLSALSGAGIGTRAAPVPVAVNTVSVVAAATRIAPVAAMGRPAQTRPTLVQVEQGDARATWRLAPVAPLYLSRRRE